MVYKIQSREESLAAFQAWLNESRINARADVRGALQEVEAALNRALKGILGVSCACGEAADDVTEVTETLRVPVCIICLTALKGAESVRSRLIGAAVGGPRGEEAICPTTERSS